MTNPLEEELEELKANYLEEKAEIIRKYAKIRQKKCCVYGCKSLAVREYHIGEYFCQEHYDDPPEGEGSNYIPM